MYRDHFSLSIKPFQITSDPSFLWLGEKHKEALATLRYGILDNRGFLLVTGEVGTGKTVLINHLLTLLDDNTLVATLSDPDLENLDFYNVLADEFNMNRTFESKGQFLIHFRNFLHQSHKNQQQVLLIIDESQRMSHKIMEDIRALSNIELHDRKLINIFFVGQQEFNNTLMTPGNRALSQRITVRYHIEPLDEDETGEYIRHRLEVAGTQEKIFKKSAVSEVFTISRGLPRLINIICDHAMLTAYTQNVTRVDGQIIKECAEELRIPLHAPKAEAASFRGTGEQSDGEDSDPNSEGNASHPQDRQMKVAGHGSIHMAEPFSFRWSRWLSNLAAILLIIGVTTYFIDRYSGNSTQHVNNNDSNHQDNRSSLGMEKAQPEVNPTAGQAQTGDAPTSGETGAVERQARPSPRPDGQTALNQTSQTQAEGNTDAETAAEPPETGKSEPFTQDKILIPFSISSNEIDAASYPLLDKIAGYLAHYPESAINIRGYTDIRGNKGYNESMSFFRANVVKSYLIGKGVYSDRMVIYAMGGANPIASNDSNEGRRKNRRVEIELQ